jgi:hypothetical protein
MDPAFIAEFNDALETAELYRGRAYHARMGAREASSDNIRAIFERLAASYDELAAKVARLEDPNKPPPYDALAETLERLQEMRGDPAGIADRAEAQLDRRREYP